MPSDVRTSVSRVPSNDASSHSHVIVTLLNPDTATYGRVIVIDGAIEELDQGKLAPVVVNRDAATSAVGNSIARKGAVDQRKCARVVDAATTKNGIIILRIARRRIAGDSAVGQRECARVVDAATTKNEIIILRIA